MRRLTCLIFAVILVAAACARPAIPPGGPIDTAAPQIVRTVPDSTRTTQVTPPSVIFRFDEVVSERPVGNTAATLSSLFLISPRDGEPSVDWSREEIAVKPRKGWRKNTVYTVTLLPGLADLRGNVRNTPATIVFSTGDSIPRTRFNGRMLDWLEGRRVKNAFVEAMRIPDSVTFVTIADSSGNFTFNHLPAATYTIRAFADENNNRGLDPREIWDTVTISISSSRDTSVTAELLLFEHDSVGPRLADVKLRDSLNLQVSFDKPIDVDQQVTPDMFRLISNTPDSSNVAIERVSAPPADTTIKRDTPLPTRRPVPQRSVILRLASPLVPERQYRLMATGVRGLQGHTIVSYRVFVPPKEVTNTAPPASND